MKYISILLVIVIIIMVNNYYCFCAGQKKIKEEAIKNNAAHYQIVNSNEKVFVWNDCNKIKENN